MTYDMAKTLLYCPKVGDNRKRAWNRQMNPQQMAN